MTLPAVSLSQHCHSRKRSSPAIIEPTKRKWWNLRSFTYGYLCIGNEESFVLILRTQALHRCVRDFLLLYDAPLSVNFVSDCERHSHPASHQRSVNRKLVYWHKVRSCETGRKHQNHLFNRNSSLNIS
ncbi:hypothetical protein TNCV_4393431 [Trichonephila clavipes]|nr:hypothetical protein TNCV_4393431 [Trichonephila clavipes]